MSKVEPNAAANAILEMASRRGLHASRLEVKTALGQVHAEEAQAQITAVWEILFEGHTAHSVPMELAHGGQLPAWVMADGCVGLVMKLPGEEDSELEIAWIGRAPDDTGKPKELLVPIPPALAPERVGATSDKVGPASGAIRAALRDHMPLFLRAGVATVVMNSLAITTSLFAMQVYDRVIPNFAEATLWVLASGVLLALGLELLFKLLRLKLLERSAVRLDEALSLYFFEKLMSLKVDRRPSRVGSLVAQFRDYDSIKNFFTSSTLYVVADLPFIALFIAVIWMIGGPIAYVLLAFLVVCLIVGIVMYKPIARLQREETDESARRLGLIFEAVAGGEIVKSTAAEPRFSDVWQRSTRAVGRVGSDLRSVTGYSQFTIAFFQQMAYISIIVVGVYVIQAGNLTMGGLIACSILASRALANIGQVTQLMLQWHHARYSLRILNEILSMPTDEDPTRQANTRVVPLQYNVFDLSYAYEGSQTPQLQIPKLTIAAGTRVAVIGHNGSGKSTLLKLLAGLGTPSAGEITLAGLDLQRARPSWIRETIGYLPQDVRLFSGTLRENLTLGLPVPDEEALHEAMEKTGLAKTLARHPEGLDLMIREGGAGLSGGQRQLVGVTRLVLQGPKVWLLDEPSASLDKDAEDALIRTLNSLPRDHTVVFTSHRPAWLNLADRVVMLENGSVKVDAPAEEVRRAQAAARAGGPRPVVPAVKASAGSA